MRAVPGDEASVVEANLRKATSAHGKTNSVMFGLWKPLSRSVLLRLIGQSKNWKLSNWFYREGW